MPLTIGTYNVLAQNLLEENKYLYEKCEDEQFLTWDYRKDQLMREIQRHKFDVCTCTLLKNVCQIVQIQSFGDLYIVYLV